MAENGMLTAEETESAKAEAIVLTEGAESESGYGWYVDTVLYEACDLLNVDLEDLYVGGYRIYTCLDADIQSVLEALLSDEANLPERALDGSLAQCAGVVMNSADGGVAAVVGGRAYTTALCFNRATGAYRQPGSLIKPIVCYAPAIDEAGYCALSYVVDEKTDFNGYSPSDYGDSYAGVMLLRDAVAQSKNVPAVKLLDAVGVEVGASYAARAGLTLAAGDQTLALALGGLTFGETPLSLCAAYAAIASGGTYNAPHTIDSISYADGSALYVHAPAGAYFMSAGGAYLLTDMLNYTVTSGTASALNNCGVVLAGKTGTVDYQGVGNSDVWAAAYNPAYTALVWMGCDTSSAETCLPSSALGGRQPASALAQLFKTIYPDGCSKWYDAPADVRAAQIDIKSSRLAMTPVLAGINTPASSIVSGYFLTRFLPQDTGTYWDPPEPPDDLSVSLTEDGAPVIRFTMANANAYYEIWRARGSGQAELVATLDGAYGSACWVDAAAPGGRRLTYSVRAVHKESGTSAGFSNGVQTLRVGGRSSVTIPNE